MLNMFGFGMMNNYEQRKVDRYDRDGLFIDTAAVTDSSHPYETAVEHPDYNNGNIVIVETYDTKEDAKAGHKKWVRIMTAKKLPKQLVDVGTSFIAQLKRSVSGTEDDTCKRKVSTRKACE